MTETIFKNKELYDIYYGGEIQSLPDLYQIEDAALIIKNLENKLEFYRGLKKKKAQDINDEIKVTENKIKFFKDVIILTLKQNEEKSVNFPGSCSATTRKQKANWTINDEEGFINILHKLKKEEDFKNEVDSIDSVLEIVTQINIKKQEANKLLDAWEKSGKLKSIIEVKGKNGSNVVEKEPAKIGVSLSFVEKEKEDEDDDINEIDNIVIPLKSKCVEDFDNL